MATSIAQRDPDLKVCDMAMGSGAFLVQACRYLSERLGQNAKHPCLRPIADLVSSAEDRILSTIPRNIWQAVIPHHIYPNRLSWSELSLSEKHRYETRPHIFKSISDRSHTINGMVADPHAVQISVDGSCFPNEKRKSGYAGVVVYPDDQAEQEVVFQGFKESTINRMELAACIAAMDWVKEEGIGQCYNRVQIFSDSQYVVDGQVSAQYWQKAKWRNSAGRPVANGELWKEFLSSRSKAGVRIDICKVRNKSVAPAAGRQAGKSCCQEPSPD